MLSTSIKTVQSTRNFAKIPAEKWLITECYNNLYPFNDVTLNNN